MGGDENVDAEYTSPPPARVVLYASLDVFEPANLHGSVYVGKSLVVGNATDEGGSLVVEGPVTAKSFEADNGNLRDLVVDSTATLPSFTSNANGGELIGSWVCDVIASSSDRRLKNSIESLNSSISALEVVQNLRPTSYRYNGTNRTRYGFIADEVAKILPNVVQKLPSGYDGILYQDIIPVVVQATKQVSAENERLREEVNKLDEEHTAKINKFEEEHTAKINKLEEERLLDAA